MRYSLLAACFFLAGCPYLPEGKYDNEVRDFDGDGVIAERFGGDDCRDNDPEIKDCDADDDGFLTVAVGGDDCDDGDPDVNPEADERCNDIDDDCDNLIDDDDDVVQYAPFWYADDDGDGYGDAEEPFQSCAAPPNTVDDYRDCDDGDSEIKPGATEFCDEIDRNCDDDYYAGAVDPINWYNDGDGDGFGFGPIIATACVTPDPTDVTDNTDCDDSAATAYPGAAEVWYDDIDQDCLGGSDHDQDGDGHDAIPAGPDCDDIDAALSPDQPEICDGGIDNDCDGVADNDDPSVEAIGQWIYYLDADGDSFGDDASATSYCPNTEPVGWVLLGGDCDDSVDSVLPGGAEVCDTLDNDCDGVVDDGAIGQVLYYLDNDGDGFGSAGVLACGLEPGYSTVDGDCNDADPQTYPGAPEICGDAFRQDCSALSVFDCDSDGHEDEAQGGDDCDDSRSDVSPSAPEICDGFDNDCDLLFDDADPSVDLGTIANWFADDDADGYGGPNLVLPNACAPVPGSANNSDDCDDNDANTYPGALEICDGLDNTCEGDVDEAPIAAPIAFFLDSDGDGYGNPDIVSALGCTPPVDGNTWVTDDTDCHDGQAAVNPLAAEICDSLDNDCDALVDEADPSATLPTWYRDDDGDGYGQTFDTQLQCAQPPGFVPLDGDCNDLEPTANPGATEVCDGGIDNDCDGLGDDADPDLATATTWYEDADGDGYGAAGAPLVQCIQPAGYINNDLDCDDTDPTISPAALELCDGGMDNDCDGDADDADPGTVNKPIWFEDSDADGWGSTSSSTSACDLPSGYLPQSGDCDDGRADINPSAPEVCDGDDNDCDGLTDDADSDAVLTVWYNDADGDGFGSLADTVSQCNFPGPSYSFDSQDCDDTNPAISPLGVEICDLRDNNCDGLTDDADPSVTGMDTWYADNDADGYGDENDVGFQACQQPPDSSSNNMDCDDTNPSASPAIPVEFCNGFDDDCDDLLDDADNDVTDTNRYYLDFDGDGWGDDADPGQEACTQPTGTVTSQGDCDDMNSSIRPDASEVCNAVDDDCDGLADDADGDVTGGSTWYPDVDNDSYGDVNFPVIACNPGVGSTLDSTDCDDLDRDINPTAAEICNGVDDNCDSLVDDADGALVGAPAWWLDADSDGFGDPASQSNKCVQPTMSVDNDTDCDDGDPTRNPLALEVCDGIDNDCDAWIDDLDTVVYAAPNWWLDLDNDSYGDPFAPQESACIVPAGYTDNDWDCDDGNLMINPTAPEVCDGLDNDCDGLTDDDDPVLFGAQIWFFDADGDGYGRNDLSVEACTQPSAWVLANDDCDDLNPAVYPILAPEICDGVDNNCDGDVDDADAFVTGQPSWYADSDGDGFGGPGAVIQCTEPANSYLVDDDCDDSNPSINPLAPEICDGLDNDCDNAVDDADPSVVGQIYFADGDDDSYGDPMAPIVACVPGAGVVLDATDCDDTNDNLHPGQSLTVGPAGADYASIQAAMDAACDDGTIRIFPGNWDETIDFAGKLLRVEGIDSNNPPVLMPTSTPIVRMESGEPDGTTLADVVLAAQVMAPTDGAAARVGPGAEVAFERVSFVLNTSNGNGGAVYVDSASADFSECTFQGNFSIGNGGAIYANAASILLSDSEFSSNSATNGGAISAFNNGDLTLVGGRFISNDTTNASGAVESIDNNSLSVFSTEFDANSGFEAIAIIDSDAILSGVSISNSLGTGIWVNANLGLKTILVSDSVFVANTVGLDVVGTTALAMVKNSGAWSNGDGLIFSSPSAQLTNITAAHNVNSGVTINDPLGSVENAILYGNGVNLDGVFTGPVIYTLFDTNPEAMSWGGTNLDGDPLFLTQHDNLEPSLWDLRIRPSSPAFDSGNPAIFDTDGSSSDAGMHGGPAGSGIWYVDSDGDTLPDGWETEFFGAIFVYGASDDPDGDGSDNNDELSNGTNPTDDNTDGDPALDDVDTQPLNPLIQ